MSLRKTKTISFLGSNVRVQELAVAEVDAFLREMRQQAENTKSYLREKRTNPDAVEPSSPASHVLDALMDSSMPFSLVQKCVPELSEEDLCGPEITATDLAPLYKAVEEVNPFFMRLAAKVQGEIQLPGRG